MNEPHPTLDPNSAGHHIAVAADRLGLKAHQFVLGSLSGSGWSIEGPDFQARLEHVSWSGPNTVSIRWSTEQSRDRLLFVLGIDDGAYLPDGTLVSVDGRDPTLGMVHDRPAYDISAGQAVELQIPLAAFIGLLTRATGMREKTFQKITKSLGGTWYERTEAAGDLFPLRDVIKDMPGHFSWWSERAKTPDAPHMVIGHGVINIERYAIVWISFPSLGVRTRIDRLARPFRDKRPGMECFAEFFINQGVLEFQYQKVPKSKLRLSNFAACVPAIDIWDDRWMGTPGIGEERFHTAAVSLLRIAELATARDRQGWLRAEIGRWMSRVGR